MTGSLIRALTSAILLLTTFMIGTAAAQGRPATKDVEVSHGGDFLRHRTEVAGVIRNKSQTRTYPCLNVLFMFERNGKWEPELMKVTGLRAGEARRYKHETGPSDAVYSEGAFPCADPVVTDRSARCTVGGALVKPAKGFRQTIKRSSNDRGTVISLETIYLRDARTNEAVGAPARRRIDHRKDLMYFTFSDVPVGRDLEVWLDYGWRFARNRTVRFQCARGGQTLDLGEFRVVAGGGD